MSGDEQFGEQFRSKRAALGLSGVVVCAKVGMPRNRLTNIERGYVTPSAEEAQRLLHAIEQLGALKEKITTTAREGGWPMAAALT